MLLGRLLLAPLLAALSLALSLVLVPALPAGAAAAPLPTTLGLTATAGYADDAAVLSLALVRSDATPVASASLVVQRRQGGTWRPIGAATTDASGRAAFAVTRSRTAQDNVFRASYAGDSTAAPATSPEVTSPLVRRDSRIRVTGPDRVVDEREVTLSLTWTTGNGVPVSGPVTLQRRSRGTGWRPVEKLRTDAAGTVEVVVAPRVDTRWRAKARRLDWVERRTSKVHRVDNLPSGVPVRLPKGAPTPRRSVPVQPRATGEGARPVISRIPGKVWSQMTGRTWHAGCPVGRSGLRLVRINYWGYDGYRYRGELVAATGAARQMAGALSDMYDARLPIRSMHRVDRFGWSGRVRGGDDFASMAAGNTSAFNCRDVVNRPGVRSPHSYGRSLDVNTWENPYRSARGLVPNSWWQPRSHPRVAWRSRSHAVVRIMAAHGLRWTYGTGDSQHFDAATSSGRVLLPRGCREVVCG